jgi:hypothetical protein
LWPLAVPYGRKESNMRQGEKGVLAPMQRDVGVTGAQERERLQERLSHVGQMVSRIDQALDRAAALVAPLLDAPRRPEAHPAFAQACRVYAETVAAVTHTRQQLFDLPMIVSLLTHAPLEERRAALRRIAQHVRGLQGTDVALDVAAANVVQAWQAMLTDAQGAEPIRGCEDTAAGA